MRITIATTSWLLLLGCDATGRTARIEVPFDAQLVTSIIRTDSGVSIDVAVDPSTCFACGSEFASLRHLSSHVARVHLGFTRAPDRTEMTILRQTALDGLRVISDAATPSSPEQVRVILRRNGRPPATFILKTPSFEWNGFVDSLRAILDPAVQPPIVVAPRP